MILLTGATGYIGSHIWIELLKGFTPVIGIDDLSNSSMECVDAISKISNRNAIFFQGDIRDRAFLDRIFSEFPVTHVIHLAALKGIQESTHRKNEYLEVNIGGMKNLLAAMRVYGCKKIIFSSSAAVYGSTASPPVSENACLAPSNYYGETKMEGERLLAREFNTSDPINSISLRYFNIAGKHSSGMLPGYKFNQAQSLFDEIEKVLTGHSKAVQIFGGNWSTHDGTCIRDYLHISDLVRGHLDALNLLDDICATINLGLGRGQSVHEVISAYENIVGHTIPKILTSRRGGDIGIIFADTSLASKMLGWSPQKTLLDMCRDSHTSITFRQQGVVS